MLSGVFISTVQFTVYTICCMCVYALLWAGGLTYNSVFVKTTLHAVFTTLGILLSAVHYKCWEGGFSYWLDKIHGYKVLYSPLTQSHVLHCNITLASLAHLLLLHSRSFGFLNFQNPSSTTIATNDSTSFVSKEFIQQVRVYCCLCVGRGSEGVVCVVESCLW